LVEGSSSPSVTNQKSSNTKDFDVEQSRAFIFNDCLADSFRRFAETKPELLQGKAVLDAGCASGVLSCLCASLGAENVLAVDHSESALTQARAVVEGSGQSSKVKLLLGQAESGQGSSFGCDVLVSERFMSDMQYGPKVLGLLAARRHHLQPGGMVFPGRLRLRLCATDFSAEADAYQKWRSESAVGRLLEDGLPLSLRPRAAVPSSLELCADVDPDRVASTDAARILTVDLSTAEAAEALPERVPFRLDLKSDRHMTSLAFYLEADFDIEAAASSSSAVSAAPANAKEGSPFSRSGLRQTVLHLPAMVAGAGSDSGAR
jgi:predicted nicotinamide N-methyase